MTASTEVESNESMREVLEEIIQRFQPIEDFFDVMGVADSGTQGVFVRRWATIGMELARSYRELLNNHINLTIL